MAVLTINVNTASPIDVTCRKAGRAAPRKVGGVFPSFNGAMRSSERGQAKVIPIITSYLTTAQQQAIDVAVANGVQIPCSGDILNGLQTLCWFDSVTSDIVPGTSPELWTMTFTMNEVNASTVLLKYAPGDTITGESFTRSTIGYYVDANGFVLSAAINTKRDGHYINGVRSLLLEDTRNNNVLWNRDQTNAAWTKVNMTTAHTSTGADAGPNSATRLTATAGNATCLQALVLGSQPRYQSAYVKRITGSGNIQMTQDNGATWTTIGITANWTRAEIPVQTLANPTVGFRIVTNGDAIDVDFVQNENGSFATSPIVVTTIAVTRAADSCSLPFTTPPQEMTVYAKFVEGGTQQTNTARLWQISNAANATPEFLCAQTLGYYTTYHITPTQVSSTLAVPPAFGDTTEVMSRLFGDGSVDVTQSINSAAATSGAQSAADPLATAWSGLLVWLNQDGAGTLRGYTALQSFKIVAGARSLSEMRGA
jgi:hypothetical protein